jgi:integrase
MNRGDIGLDKNIGKPLTTQDILKLVNVAAPREKALIYLMALSGMGQQEARDLTIKKYIKTCSEALNIEITDVYDLFKQESQILKKVLTLIITRKKVKYQHHTFIPPETSREIITYLKERCYGRNQNIRIKSNQDPIFVNSSGAKLGRDSIVSNFRRAGQRAGFPKEKGSYSYWRSHALRKYFISTIINKTGEKIIADYLAGHKINDQDRTYWRINPEDLKKHYLKALPYLSIDEAQVKNIKSEDYHLLVEELKKKDEIIADMEEKIKIKDNILREMMENQFRSNKSK